MANLERLQEIWSHAIPSGEFSKIVKRLAQEAVAKNDPIKKAEATQARNEKANVLRKAAARAKARPCSARTDSVSREISPNAAASVQNSRSPGQQTKAEIKRIIWLRDNASCTFKDPRTAQRCDSRHFLEEDHIVPKAMGGDYSVENLRMRCRAHNQRHAIDSYGLKKIRRYVRAPSVSNN